MSDDPRPHGAGEPPRIPPPRRSGRPRGFRPPPSAAATPGLPPKVTMWATTIAVIVLLVAVARYLGVFESEPTRTFQSAGKPKVGTSPEAAAAAERETAEKRKEAEALFGPEIWTAKDGAPLAEEDAWARVLATMAAQDPNAVSARVDFSLNASYDDVLKEPARFRGRFFRMRGLVASNFHAYKLVRMVADHENVYRGLIADTDGEHWAFFDLLDPPPHFRTMTEKPPNVDIVFSNADAVDVEGVLYRTVSYMKRGDPKDLEHDPPRLVTVPWIIARTVVRCQTDEDRSDPLTFAVGALTAFLALVAAIVYLVRRGRRQSASPGPSPTGFRTMFEQKLREERLRKPPATPDGGRRSGDESP